MKADELAREVRQVVADAEVHATDLTGEGDHWHVVVVAASFAGRRSFQRQRPILAHFMPHFSSGVVHALDVKCLTPEEAQGGIPAPFVPHGPGEGQHPAAWE